MIEDLPPEERGNAVPFDWDLNDRIYGGFKTGEMTVLFASASDIPGKDWTNDQIAEMLAKKGHDQSYIDSYISGWRQLDKKA